MTRTLFTVASCTAGMEYTLDGSRYLEGFMSTVLSDVLIAASAAPLSPGILCTNRVGGGLGRYSATGSVFTLNQPA